MKEWELNKHQEEFFDNLISDQFSEKKTIEVVRMMQLRIKKFEAEVRADQDKITRHECAESVDMLNEECIKCGGIYHESAHAAIMNTKTP